MRVVCHSQHLTGIGHHVRMHCIAAALAGEHEVHLVEGGREVPRPRFAAEPERLAVPTLVRAPDGTLRGADGSSGDEVLAARASVLAEAIARLRPDVLLVDHYPFSKWELDAEIDTAIAAARSARREARVVCSLRDIAPQTRHERVDGPAYVREVERRLGAGFDALLVHADPTWSRLADTCPVGLASPVPVRATGYVCEPTLRARDGEIPSEPFVVASAGGLHATEFLLAVVAAHERMVATVPGAPGVLHVFAPAGADDHVLDALRQADGPAGRVAVHRFSERFAAWLDAAALSVSRAGYNTSTATMRARTPAVLVPDPLLSDQAPRARVLDEHGAAIAVVSSDAAPAVDVLARAMTAALDGGVPRAGPRLDGAAMTVELLERLVAGEEPWAPEWQEATE